MLAMSPWFSSAITVSVFVEPVEKPFYILSPSLWSQPERTHLQVQSTGAYLVLQYTFHALRLEKGKIKVMKYPHISLSRKGLKKWNRCDCKGLNYLPDSSRGCCHWFVVVTFLLCLTLERLDNMVWIWLREFHVFPLLESPPTSTNI